MNKQNDETLSTLAQLDAPTIPVALEGGLIPIEHYGSPIIVNFPVWPSAEDGYTYQLVFDDVRVPPEKPILESDKPGDVLNVDIPVELLVEGFHTVAYRVYSPNTEIENFSATTQIQIDKTAPGAPELAPILLPQEVQDGLTSDELEAMNNVLPGRIAGYTGMAAGDVIRTYWGTVEGPEVVVDANDMGLKRVMVDFPRVLLEQIGDGQHAVHYRVTDLAGNVSQDSEKVTVELKLSVVTPLPLPTILEAENDILDPANAPNGATVVIADSANLRQGDTVNLSWNGPNGSDQKEKSITQDDAGKALSVVFARALVDANDGQTVAVSYQVIRANGTSQDSEVYSVRVMSASVLPAPTMDTVQEDGVVNPGLIPEAGATVRARYEVRAGDRVKVIWEGASRFETAEQEATGGTELVFQLPKALITASAGAQATLSYQVSRGGNVRDSERRTLRVQNPLSLDTSPVTLGGKVYLVPSRPDTLPTMPGGTTVQRQASGGTAPYTYTSADPRVAQVSEAGLVSVRGKGTTTITVADAAGQSLSYAVTVTGVIHCIELGKGNFGQAGAQAGNNQARLPSIQELREIHGMWAANWPLVKDLYWSSTLAKLSPFGKTYYQKALGSGMELDGYTYSVISAIGIR